MADIATARSTPADTSPLMISLSNIVVLPVIINRTTAQSTTHRSKFTAADALSHLLTNALLQHHDCNEVGQTVNRDQYFSGVTIDFVMSLDAVIRRYIETVDRRLHYKERCCALLIPAEDDHGAGR